MKKIFLTLLTFFIIKFSFACPFCGCGTGNYFIGLLPQFDKHFVGVRYRLQSFKTEITGDKSQFSKDFYQTVELWGGFQLGKKVQVLVFVPYNINHEKSDDGITNTSGLGDAALLVNYKIFQTRHANISQQLWLGAGIKAPTGKFDADIEDEDIGAVANQQTGTGTTDFLLNGMYNISLGKISINTSAIYKLNTTNKDDYRFGNRFSANSFVSYSIKNKSAVIAPNAGIMFETSTQNKLTGLKVDQTGGHALSAACGVEFNFSKIAVGFNVQAPLEQNFAAGQTALKVRGMAHVTFAL